MCIFLSILRVFACAFLFHLCPQYHTIKPCQHYFAKKNYFFYCARRHIFRHPRHNTLARLASCAIILWIMANKARRGKIKPWGEGIIYPGPNYLPSEPLPDERLEQFAILMARNASRRRAVLTAFPNACTTATAYRAVSLLAKPGIKERVAWLRRRAVDVTAGRASVLVDDPGQRARKPDADDEDLAVDGVSTDRYMEGEGVSTGRNKRRSNQPADLTPAELRLIISEGARAGNSAAINAAIKMLDASLSAPPALVDPAAVCAVLFNGGGGGETLHRIILRLFDVFGAQAVMGEVRGAVSHNKSYVSLNQSQNQSQSVAPQRDTRCDNMSHNGADSADGAGQAGSAAESVEGHKPGHKPTGGTGEGGESGRPSTYRIYSENFEHENATKLRGKVPVIPKSDEEAPSEA